MRWVTNPHQFRAKTRMPNFMFKPEEGEAIALAVLALGNAWHGRVDRAPRRDILSGLLGDVLHVLV